MLALSSGPTAKHGLQRLFGDSRLGTETSCIPGTCVKGAGWAGERPALGVVYIVLKEGREDCTERLTMTHAAMEF